MRPTNRGIADIKRAAKQGETAHEKAIQDDFRHIDANFSRSKGQIISDWRVQNGLPPLDVEKWDNDYAIAEQEKIARGEKVNTYRQERKLLVPRASSGSPSYKNPRALQWTNLHRYQKPKDHAKDGDGEESRRGGVKRKEIPNSTDIEQDEDEEDEVDEDKDEGEEEENEEEEEDEEDGENEEDEEDEYKEEEENKEDEGPARKKRRAM